MQELSASVVAVLALGIALTIMWRRGWQASRLTVVLMLLAGFGITAGLVGQLLTRGGETIAAGISTGTAQLFGVGVPLLLVAVMITVLVVDMKDRVIHKATPWVALALPNTLAVVGGIYVGLGNSALGLLGQGMTNIATVLGSVG